MTDIVERLLLKKTLETVEDVHVLFADAADEIERLRAALRPFVEPCIEHCHETCESEEERMEDCICFKARTALREKE